MRALVFMTSILCANLAHADGLQVQFADGAPKDSLTFRNDGCALSAATIVIDLRNTPAGLIFDVTASGAGVEVFQPVEVTAGEVSVSPVADGGQVLHLYVPSLPLGDTLRLTADLDDTTSNRQITVNGSEMIGATVSVSTEQGTQSAPFDTNGLASVILPANADGCQSA